jgi:hypothetical protein
LDLILGRIEEQAESLASQVGEDETSSNARNSLLCLVRFAREAGVYAARARRAITDGDAERAAFYGLWAGLREAQAQVEPWRYHAARRGSARQSKNAKKRRAPVSDEFIRDRVRALLKSGNAKSVTEAARLLEREIGLDKRQIRRRYGMK